MALDGLAFTKELSRQLQKKSEYIFLVNIEPNVKENSISEVQIC